MPSAETVQFTPVNYDVDNLPPEAPPGAWTLLIKQAKIGATNPLKGAFPMVTLTVMLDDAHDEGNKSFIGTELMEYLCFFPESHKGHRMQKQRLRAWLDACSIDYKVIPKSIRKPSDLKPLVEALTGAQCPGWTISVIDKQTGQPRAQIRLTEPRDLNLGGLAPLEATDTADDEVEEAPEEPEDDEEEETEPEPPPPPPTVSGKKKKNGNR